MQQAKRSPVAGPLTPPGLGAVQLAWLAAAVFVVSAGYGALMPLLPNWLVPLLPDDAAADIARHVGFLGGAYAAGVLVGAPLWGMAADRWGRGRILVVGMIGYAASLLPMLRPDLLGLYGVYALRATTGFAVAAVVPVVPALVAEYTAPTLRARRFAWLGAMSLLGFLFGPGLDAAASKVSATLGRAGLPTADSATLVIAISAGLGAAMMLGLAATLPEPVRASEEADPPRTDDDQPRANALWLLNGTVMFVLSGFELGIVLQGQQHPSVGCHRFSGRFR